jgi:hypothetical protein
MFLNFRGLLGAAVEALCAIPHEYSAFSHVLTACNYIFLKTFFLSNRLFSILEDHI